MLAARMCDDIRSSGLADDTLLSKPMLLGRAASLPRPEQVCCSSPGRMHDWPTQAAPQDAMPRSADLHILGGNLVGHIAGFLMPRSVCRCRKTCGRFNDVLRPPTKSVEALQAKLQDYRPIVREMAVKPLIALGRQGCQAAVVLALAVLRDEDQSQLLRTWILDSLTELIELGEYWPVLHVVSPGGPLTSSNLHVRTKATEVLSLIAIGSSSAIEALEEAIPQEMDYKLRDRMNQTLAILRAGRRSQSDTP